MNLKPAVPTLLALILLNSTLSAALLDGYTLTSIPVVAKHVAYDSTRNLFYASIPSTAGLPYGNSIISIDPSSFSIVNSRFVGSEPSRLAVANDGSRVYVGIDGARSFTWWQTTDNTVATLVPLKSRFGDPSIVEDFAVSLLNPNVVVVSKDQVGSTASGDLEVFQNGMSTFATTTSPLASGNEITFVDAQTLFSLNNSSTAFTSKRWNFNGSTLSGPTSDNGQINQFSARIEAQNGLIFASNGMVMNPNDFTLLGTFAVQTNSAVEPISSLNETFAVGPTTTSDTTLSLKLFDNQTFIPLAAKSFAPYKLNGSVVELISAANGALAFVTSSGQLGIISPVPEPSSCGLPLWAALYVIRRRRMG